MLRRMVPSVWGCCVHFVGCLWGLPCLRIIGVVVVLRLEGNVHTVVGFRCLQQCLQTPDLLGKYLLVCHQGCLFEWVVLPICLSVLRTLSGLMMSTPPFHVFVLSTICIPGF